MTTTKHSLAEIANAAGIRPFEVIGGYHQNATHTAERALAGRTHYYDPDTRRCFDVRVLDVKTDRDGIILATVESMLHPAGGRLYRAMLFDLTGVVLDRTQEKAGDFQGWRTAAAARKEARRMAKAFTPRNVLAQAIARRQKETERAQADLARGAAMLAEEADAP